MHMISALGWPSFTTLQQYTPDAEYYLGNKVLICIQAVNFAILADNLRTWFENIFNNSVVFLDPILTFTVLSFTIQDEV